LPGIIIQIVLIPAIVSIIRRFTDVKK